MAGLLRHRAVYGRLACLVLVSLALLCACTGSSQVTLPSGYLSSHDVKPVESSPPEVIRAFESGLNAEYLLGPGDVIEIISPIYPEIAGEQTISPDGQITVYPAGAVQVGGLTRADAEKKLLTALNSFYKPISINLRVKSYENNQVLVLGKVMTPGVIKFKSRPNLLEALARAGAFPAGSQERRISRCDIIRGRDQILLVSIDEMLKGGTSSRNLDLANNDIIYIPENEENNVYVMGEVNKPGVFEIRTPMTLLNAIMMAGGPTETAVTDNIYVVREFRDGGHDPLVVNLDRIINKADYTGNIQLARNDIIVVPRSVLGSVNYYFRMINPFTQLFITGYTLGTKKP